MSIKMPSRVGSFAHLLGFGASPEAKAAPTDELLASAAMPAPIAAEPPPAPVPAPAASDAPAADDDEGEAKAKKAKAKKAKSDPDDDGDDDDDEEGDDDNDRDEMAAASPRRAVRLRERARCAAIFADEAAAANPALAASLAFGTDLPRGQAVALLRAGGVAPRAQGLAGRMAAAAVPAVAPDAPPAPAEQPGASTVAIYNRFRPSKTAS